MHLIINGENRDFTQEKLTVKDAVEATLNKELQDDGTAVDGTKLGIAVAVAEQVVPRSQWASTEVSQGQSLEIITAVQGG